MTANEYSRHNAHGHKLLEEQLGGVRDVNLTELGLVVTVSAIECLLAEICDGNHATLVTYMHPIRVAISIQTVS